MQPHHPGIQFSPRSNGLASLPLYFTWQLPATETQTAFQLQVFTDRAGRRKVEFDTGEIQSEVSQFVLKQIDLITPGHFSWQVRFRNSDQKWSKWSQPVKLVFGPETWQAQWIRPAIAAFPDTTEVLHVNSNKFKKVAGIHNLHFYLRKKIEFPQRKLKHAACFVTGDDHYQLFLDGKFIGQGPAPAYHFDYYFNYFDLTDLLQSDTPHVLAVQGYYHGMQNWGWVSGDGRFGLLLELHLDFDDGTYEVIVTDETWHSHVATEYAGKRLTAYDTQFLEDWTGDAAWRAWLLPEFDDHEWAFARVVPETDYTFTPQPTPVLDVYRQLPVLSKQLADSIYWFDFGREIVGAVQFRLAGPAGITADVRHGEELTPDGRVRFQMRASTTYQETITKTGGEDLDFEFADYKAFRFLEIILPDGIPGAVSAVAARVRHYPVPENHAEFTTSDSTLQSVWNLCRYTIQMGVQEGYLDCPTREKGQYLGDAFVTAPAQVWLTGDLALLKKTIQIFAHSTRLKPYMLAVAPAGRLHEFADYSLLWPGLLWEYYRHSGDREFLTAMVPELKKLLAVFSQWENPDGLLEHVTVQNLVDWPTNLRDNYDFERAQSGVNTVLNALWFYALDCARRISAELEDSGEFAEKQERVRQAFNRQLWDPQAGLFVDARGSRHHSLHANAAPLFAGAIPDSAVPSILNFIDQKGLNCGVYFANFVLKGLFHHGAAETGLELLTSHGLHSWYNMLQKGATTTLEAWDPDLKWNTSFCHPWACCPITIISEELFGISPAEPGWKVARIFPQIPLNLAQLRIKIPTWRGVIDCDYIRQSDKIDFQVQLPGGMGAEIAFPAFWGLKQIRHNGKILEGMTTEVMKIPAGKHYFEITLSESGHP